MGFVFLSYYNTYFSKIRFTKKSISRRCENLTKTFQSFKARRKKIFMLELGVTRESHVRMRYWARIRKEREIIYIV